MVESQRVLVTGGSGYIASFCIARLLGEGVQVRTTVRSAARAADVRAAIAKLVVADHRLEIVVADLVAEAGWRDACADCSGVLHVASPFPVRASRRRRRTGATGPRRRAQGPHGRSRRRRARRVVMTSSTAAVAYGHGGRSQPWTEADWSDPENRRDSSAYERSKAIAERAAWELARPGGRRAGARHDLPGCRARSGARPRLLGLARHRQEADRRLAAGPGAFRLAAWPTFATSPTCMSGRFTRRMRPASATSAPVRSTGWRTSRACCANACPSSRAGCRSASCRAGRYGCPPSSIPALRGRLFELDKERPVSADKARRELGWTPRSADEAIVDTARSLIAEGIIDRPTRAK